MPDLAARLVVPYSRPETVDDHARNLVAIERAVNGISILQAWPIGVPMWVPFSETVLSSEAEFENFYVFAGQLLAVAEFRECFRFMGYTHGGSGASFNLPDMRGRVPVGKDDMGGSAASRVTSAGSGVDGATLGAVGGHQLLQAHVHDELFALSANTSWATGGPLGAFYIVAGARNTGSTGGGNGQNMQPSIVGNWIGRVR